MLSADCCLLFLHFFSKIFVLEDIRRGADKAEADFVFAGFAVGEVLAADHDDFVGFAVVAVVDNFVDARLANGIAGAISPAIAPAAAMTRILESAALKAEERPPAGKVAARNRVVAQAVQARG